MDKSVTTEKDLGVITTYGPDAKFRDARHKARQAEEERNRKAKRDKQERLPKHRIGDQVVLVENKYRDRHYKLVEIIDAMVDPGKRWYGDLYYAITLRVTDPERLHIVGRLCHFTDWHNSSEVVKTDPNGIKWLEEKDGSEAGRPA